MVILIFYLLIIDEIKYVIPIVPLWNFDSSTIDLLQSSDSCEYTIYSGTADSYTVNLKKTITRTDGTISQKNIITINEDTFETNWEDIHSIYGFDTCLYICPTGNNHLSKYVGSSNGGFYEYKPSSYDYSGDIDFAKRI